MEVLKETTKGSGEPITTEDEIGDSFVVKNDETGENSHSSDEIYQPGEEQVTTKGEDE